MVKAHSKLVNKYIPMAGFIYITGCDGTGKTTQTRFLLEQFRSQGINVKHTWLRFPFLFSLPLLFYARLRRLSWYERHGTVRYGYWKFHSSWIMRYIFPWVLLLDASILTMIKVLLPLWKGETIVCERFVFDMLVDLTIALNDLCFIDKVPGRLFIKLLPKNSIVVVLTLDYESLQKRRFDLIYDKKLKQRLQAYEILAARYSLPTFSTKGKANEINNEIHRILRVEKYKRNQSPPNKYCAFKASPTINKIMRYPISGVIVHWLLQSILYIDKTELIFKFCLEFSVILIFYPILKVKLDIFPALIFALLISHTINFLFNAQLFVVLKHYGLVHHTEKEFSNYIDELKRRLSKESSIRFAAVYGSYVRGKWKPSSDLDVRLVRVDGWIAGLRACIFLVRERTLALFSGFPLDIYVLDNFSRLNLLNRLEDPLIILQRG